jgi:predicted SAM-dependent methyltransferase
MTSADEAGGAAPGGVRRLNWGCGTEPDPGWINSDVKDGPGIDISCDALDGLPLADDSIDYCVSVHALPEIPYPDLVPVLRELRRVLKPGGTLRLCLPDLQRGIRAYESGDADYFKVRPGEVESLGGRFIVHMLWYGYSRTLFTADFAEELLRKAGFESVVECSFKTTASRFPEIVELDNREDESLFVEGTKPIYTSAMPRNQRIKVVDVSVAEADKTILRASNVDLPKAGAELDSNALQIVGWAVGRDARAESVEVVTAGEVVATSSLEIERPGVAKTYGEVAGADKAGFQVAVPGSGKGRHELQVRAVLSNGSKAPIGTIEVEIRRLGLLDRLWDR